jgi:hypothetical protein
LLQTFLRGFRELGATPAAGAPQRPAFEPPIALVCPACGEESVLLPGGDATPAGSGSGPVREALRCRPCGRSIFALSASFGFFAAGLDPERTVGLEERYDEIVLEARCIACGSVLPAARLGLRSERAARLALLQPDSGA